jgi:hypothetical protein
MKMERRKQQRTTSKESNFFFFLSFFLFLLSFSYKYEPIFSDLQKNDFHKDVLEPFKDTVDFHFLSVTIICYTCIALSLQMSIA